MRPARWVTEAEVVSLLSLEEALDPLEAGLRRLAGAGAVTIPKAMHAWGTSSVHSLGAVDPVAGIAGFKTWINTPNGAVALLNVFDTDSGQLRAVIEAGVLGAMRTSGVTALATRVLAAPDAAEVTIIGSGRQAQLQLAAIALVRPLRKVRFWSPTAEKRAAAAEAARKRFGLDAITVDTLEDALRDAPIVATVTRARDPFLALGMLASGVHLNAVGAILPGFAEIVPDVLASANLIVADSVDGVSALRELQEAAASDPTVAKRLYGLAEMLAAESFARPSAPRLTVFKSVGIGASDLALAGEVLVRAEAKNVGRPIDPPTPAPPRWRAN